MVRGSLLSIYLCQVLGFLGIKVPDAGTSLNTYENIRKETIVRERYFMDSNLNRP
jgi:hypothetical protein